MPKLMTRNLTSLDFLKSFAVVIMLIDHIGIYFYPDDIWWRVVGRIGFPIWFFLIGYSTGRAIPIMLWAGAIALEIMDYIAGLGLFPLNALFTIIFIRLMIDKCMEPVIAGRWSLWALALALLVLALPTYIFTEYGTLALITAIFGYLVRHRQHLGERLSDPRIVFFYMWFALVSFVVIQQFVFGFDYLQMACVFAGTLCVRSYLYTFKYLEFPRATAQLPRPVTGALQFMGRHTLEIFIVHLCAFKLLSVYWGIEGSWLTWRWLPPV